MQSDIRGTDHYKRAEAFFLKVLGPAFGQVSTAEYPVPSPGGTEVAFTGSHLTALEGRPKKEICIVPVDGETTIERIAPGSSPTWSPDGESLAFIAESDGRGALAIATERAGQDR